MSEIFIKGAVGVSEIYIKGTSVWQKSLLRGQLGRYRGDVGESVHCFEV